MTRTWLKSLAVAGALLALALGGLARAASHREAPLTAIDRTADITDFYAFVSYDDPNCVTLIMGVDPLLEPANGPNYFPFDEALQYAIKIDNNNDAVEDITFEFRFKSEQRLPGVPVGFAGAGDGIAAPDNSPAPVPPGTPIIPPEITELDGPGSEGLGFRQSYTVTMVLGTGLFAVRIPLGNSIGGTGTRLFAVPSNVGPRTMPNYAALAAKGIYTLSKGVKAFAGTTDDAFWIDLGATFDSLNFRVLPGTDVNGMAGFGSTGVPAVLTDGQDGAESNFVSDSVSGYNVNHIAIQVPTKLLTRTGNRPGADHPASTIGTWATTSRQAVTLRTSGRANINRGGFTQVQRMGHPLFNELLIGTATKDFWSRSQPKADAQFAAFALDPLIARIANAAYMGALTIPEVPRRDLLPLVQYLPPIAPASAADGPVADLLRLNVGVNPTPAPMRSRLGLLAGDPAGAKDDEAPAVVRIYSQGRHR